MITSTRRRFTVLWQDMRQPEGYRRYRLASLAAVAAGLSKAISIAALFISTPLVLRYLGVERYGIWLALGSFVAIASHIDFGLTNGVVNGVAAAAGRGDRRSESEVVSTAFLMLSAIAAVAVLLATAGFSL